MVSTRGVMILCHDVLFSMNKMTTHPIDKITQQLLEYLFYHITITILTYRTEKPRND